MLPLLKCCLTPLEPLGLVLGSHRHLLTILHSSSTPHFSSFKSSLTRECHRLLFPVAITMDHLVPSLQSLSSTPFLSQRLVVSMSKERILLGALSSLAFLDPFTLQTHSCGFTLDLVITISCGPPEPTREHPTSWSPPPTILLSSLDLSNLEFQTYGSKSQLDTPTWMSDKSLTYNIAKAELLSSPLPPTQLPLSSGHLEPGVDQNRNHLSKTILFVLACIQSVGKHSWFCFQDLSKT